MVMGMGMRTIWISLRAMNYTDRAFRQTIKNLDNLNEKERKHIENGLKMLKGSQMNVQAGMLYAAMAGMAAQQLFALAGATELGSAYMSEFNSILEETKTAFADTFFTTLRPILDIVKTFMELLRDNAALRQVVVYLALAAVAGVALFGTWKLMVGMYQMITGWMTVYAWLQKKELILKFQGVMANLKLAASNHILATSLLAVGAGLGIAFGLFFALKDILGPIPAAILAVAASLIPLVVILWKAAVATSILTAGIATIAGLAAIGGAMGYMNMAGIASFATGVRSAPYTGPMMVHKGEVIYNPATGRPTGVAAELAREGGPSVTHQKVDISIENLNTEVPYDEVEDKLGKTLRRNMRNSR